MTPTGLLLVLLAIEPDVQSLLERAAALPPELNADVILRVLEAGKVNESEKELELVEQAFRLAQQARLAAPLRYAAGVAPRTNSTIGTLAAASELKLDRLSLSERALDKMIALHPRLARDRFLSMEIAPPAAPSCNDALVPRFEPYFRLLFAMLETGFSPDERSSGQALRYVAGQLNSLTSPEQMEAAAAILADAPLTSRERAGLADALASSLIRCRTTWRSFGRYQELAKAIDQVARRLSAAGESTEDLNRALASYIQKHQGVSPCEEAPIDYAFWSSPESKQLWTRFEALRSAEPGPALRAFLNDLDRVPLNASWFHERMILARSLLTDIPAGPMRDEQWEITLRLLSDSPLLSENPAAWLLEVREILKLPEAAVYVSRVGGARLQLMIEADKLLGPRK